MHDWERDEKLSRVRDLAEEYLAADRTRQKEIVTALKTEDACTVLYFAQTIISNSEDHLANANLVVLTNRMMAEIDRV